MQLDSNKLEQPLLQRSFLAVYIWASCIFSRARHYKSTNSHNSHIRVIHVNVDISTDHSRHSWASRLAAVTERQGREGRGDGNTWSREKTRRRDEKMREISLHHVTSRQLTTNVSPNIDHTTDGRDGRTQRGPHKTPTHRPTTQKPRLYRLLLINDEYTQSLNILNRANGDHFS